VNPAHACTVSTSHRVGKSARCCQDAFLPLSLVASSKTAWEGRTDSFKGAQKTPPSHDGLRRGTWHLACPFLPNASFFASRPCRTLRPGTPELGSDAGSKAGGTALFFSPSYHHSGKSRLRFARLSFGLVPLDLTLLLFDLAAGRPLLCFASSTSPRYIPATYLARHLLARMRRCLFGLGLLAALVTLAEITQAATGSSAIGWEWPTTLAITLASASDTDVSRRLPLPPDLSSGGGGGFLRYIWAACK
jgi:hypothetical protein